MNNNHAFTGWILCIMSHIWKDTLNIINRNHRQQVNTVMKSLFYYISGDDLHYTLDTFWIEYNILDHKNYPLGSH